MLNKALTRSDRSSAYRCAATYNIMFPHLPHPYVLQGWQEGAITFNPTYKYHLGCNIYSGDPLPPGVGAVKAVDSYASLTDSEATTEGKRLGLKHCMDAGISFSRRALERPLIITKPGWRAYMLW